jgi:cystathionine beta-lyase/cystathionine gamma-synthase
MADETLDFETLAAHAGTRTQVGGVISTVAPITASTTFTYETVAGVHDALAPDGSGFAYARNANPTVVSLEQAIAALEGADEAVAFGSGMAAIYGALIGSGLQKGDSIVAAEDLYGVTRSLLIEMEDLGIRTRFVDVLDLEAVAGALREEAATVLLFESISNPLLKVADVPALARLGHEYGATVVIDNTFASPLLLRPLEHGVDVVVHSATKYIAGHGDVVAGVVAASAGRAAPIRHVRTLSGGVLSPFEAWLTLRGIRTLPLRVARQSESALQLARWLQERPWIAHVYYPGLNSHAQHQIASRQFGALSGGMVAFDLRANRETTIRFIDALQLITPGTSLGDVESLILYPVLTSHRTLSPEQSAELGIGEGLLRLSVGLETVRDLTGDLQRAAETAGVLDLVGAHP